MEYNGTRPYLTGGPLKSKYVFDSLHIHWGAKKGHGSEHMMDGQAGDLEMHFIHRNLKYDSFAEAASAPDGLVVIGVLCSASKHIRPFNLFKNMNDLRDPKSSVVLTGRPASYVLRNIIGNIGEEFFYAYRGSLTTPPCSQSVLWIVAQRIRKISYEDVSKSGGEF